MINRLLILATLLLGLSAISVAAQGGGPAASRVYGQPDFTANAVGHDAAGLFFPIGLAQDSSGGLYVADRNNSRILYYAADGDSTADRVYGQHGDLDSYTQNYDGAGGSSLPDADTLSFPVAIALGADGGLYVTDRENHRVLYYAPGADTTADRVYGQFGSFTTNPPNNDSHGANGVPSAANIGVYALGILGDSGGGLYVSDSSNNRVLYFAAGGETTADKVYGQFGTFSSGVKNNDGNGQTGTPSAESMNFPRGLALDSGGLYVCDRMNNRVLFFAADGDTKADRVYGHSGSFASVVPNDDGAGNTSAPTANNFTQPPSAALDRKGGLYVADRDNNRVLYFADDGDTTADWVFGQFGSFTTNVANNDGYGAAGAPSAQNVSHPQFVLVGADGSLFVSDTGNNRVLVLPPDVLP